MIWKYRKRMLICNDIYNEHIFSKAEIKALFKQYPKALMLRYTTNFDQTESDAWYCCIKDTPYDFDSLKSKRKNTVRKGISNFTVKEIKLCDYVDEYCALVNDAYQGYKVPSRMSLDNAQKKAWQISENPAYFVLGAFCNEDGKLAGYVWCHVNGAMISMSEQKAIRAYESRGVNAALVHALCEKYNAEYTKSGHYLFDGWKNVLHETAFQEYLIKYFGFRYAYSKLHVVCNPRYAWILKIALATLPLWGWALKRVKLAAYLNIVAVKKLLQLSERA